MKISIPAFCIATLFVLAPATTAQATRPAGSRVPVEVPTASAPTMSLKTSKTCVERIKDQATGNCLQASSTPTLGLLFPYPGFDNSFVGGAIVGGGSENRATARWSTIGGGRGNTASGYGGLSAGSLNGYATVVGGLDNQATGDGACVGGGKGNVASGYGYYGYGGFYVGGPSTVAGGRLNQATGKGSTIGGGSENTASVTHATVGGGFRNTVSGASAATIGGGSNNAASGLGATVGGGILNFATGPRSTIAGGEFNAASWTYATVGGGEFNTASAFHATVAGGERNTASGIQAAVGGGSTNTASGYRSTVSGGEGNAAQGGFSFAAGRRAKASHDGAFVWGDSVDADKPSSTADEFSVYASGGVRMFTNSAATTGAALAPGSGTWSMLSDRDSKENVGPVDAQAVLDGVVAMPLSTWNYKEQDDSVRHMGPMAQDFHAAFGLGVSDKLIDAVDSDGVALAAIQGLHALVQEKDAKLEQLRAEKDAEIAELRARLDRLEGLGMAR